MTFGGQEMFALLMTTAFLFFACIARKRAWLWLLCALLMATALLLGFTRGIWLASAGAGLYLLWFWKRRLAAALPVALVADRFSGAGLHSRAILILAEPRQTRFQPASHRHLAHGLRNDPRASLVRAGSEEVKLQFNSYVPADIPRPLPEGWYGHLHNIYLQYAAERGIPTMLLMLWMLGQILWDCLRGVWRLPPGRSDLKFVLHGAVAVVIATMIAGIFEYNLGDSEVLTMFLVVTGCAYAAMDCETRKNAAVA